MNNIHIFPVSDSLYSEIVSGNCSMEKGPWVAGGSARKVWQNKNWKGEDIDFFFADEVQFNAFSNKVITGGIGERQGYDHNTENANSYTIKFHSGEIIKIQAIKKRWYPNWQELIDGFDFNVTQFVSDGKTIVATDEAVDGCNNNELLWNKKSLSKLKPLRVLKYVIYGFNPDKELLINSTRLAASGEMGFNDY